MECILDWSYLLLKDPQGGVKNTVPHGYGVYFSLLYLSLVGKLRWGESQIQFHKDMECILDCNYLLLKNSAGESQNTVSQGYGMYFRLKLSLIEKSTGESVKYRSTGICNVFQAVIISCRKLCWESVEYSSTGVWNVFQFTVCVNIWKLSWGIENTVPQGYGIYFWL